MVENNEERHDLPPASSLEEVTAVSEALIEQDDSVYASDSADMNEAPEAESHDHAPPAHAENHGNSHASPGHGDHGGLAPIIIVIKKKRKQKHPHHGGAWKIAYADFVTAMMAFFLMMWLLSLINKAKLGGIAEYFGKPASKVEGRYNPIVDSKNKDHNEETGKERDMGTEKERAAKQDKGVGKEDKKGQIDSKSTVSKVGDGQSTSPNPPLSLEQQKQILENMKKDIQDKVDKDPNLSQFKNHLDMKVTDEGLKINLHDLEGKPMFSSSKADFQNYSKDLLKVVADAINTYPNNVLVIGHTDGVPFQGSAYGNWELSSDRANAARRALINQGMDEKKIYRVMGVANTDPLDTVDPKGANNRRIEVVVLTDDAMKKLVYQ
jgi:chemotaxis protein MotB